MKLTEYGKPYQIKSIAALLYDKKFYATIHDIIEPDFYDSEIHYILIDELKKYYKKYKVIPEIDDLKQIVNNSPLVNNNKVLKVTIEDEFINIRKYASSNLDYIKDEILTFSKNQRIKAALEKSIDHLEKGNFDAIRSEFANAFKVGTSVDLGHDYKAQVLDRYNKAARKCIPTGWDLMNKVMDGGLSPGEIGCVVAPSGIGKSWVLVHLAYSALMLNKNVVYITCELNEAYTGLRFDAIHTGIAVQNLKYHVDEIVEEVNKIQTNLRIKYYPAKTANCTTIFNYIEQLKSDGFVPDIIMVDYPDLMNSVQINKELRHELGNIYVELRGLSGEVGAPIWVASQTNKSGIEADTIEAGSVGESYAKVMTSDFVFSLQRKIENKLSSSGTFHIIKNRFGPDGMTFPIKMDTNTGKIYVYDPSTIEGDNLKKDMAQKGEVQVKSLLQQKFEISKQRQLTKFQ